MKPLSRGTSVLILDEPTSALAPVEVHDLSQFLKRLRAGGKSVVFITHKLKEVLELSDRVVVLRNGQVTGEIATVQATPEGLAEMMVGRKVVARVSRAARPPGAPVLPAPVRPPPGAPGPASAGAPPSSHSRIGIPSARPHSTGKRPGDGG